MDILRKGMITPAVKRWQTFLMQTEDRATGEAYYNSAIDGVFDRALEKATRKYQRDTLGKDTVAGRKIYLKGMVDTVTVLKAMETGNYTPEPIFRMRPNADADIREARPYFLVPLPEPPESMLDKFSDRAKVAEDIHRWVAERAESTPPDEPVITDLFIFSHGWHRNFYSGVSAYDRMVSRLTRLIRAGRFDPPEDQADFKPSCGVGFRPLFLNLHWHSDPGSDDFVDKSGRRDKDSFMQKALAAFEPKDPTATAEQMVTDLEDIFAYFCKMAAPDIDPLAEDANQTEPQKLLENLHRYQLKNIPESGLSEAQHASLKSEKAVVAWTCYHEATVQAVLLDQNEGPATSGALARRLMTLVNFGRKFLAPLAVLVAGLKILFHYLQWPSHWIATLKTPEFQSIFVWTATWRIPIKFEAVMGAGQGLLRLMPLVFYLSIAVFSYVEGQSIDLEDRPDRARSVRFRAAWYQFCGGLKLWLTLLFGSIVGIALTRMACTPVEIFRHSRFLIKQHNFGLLKIWSLFAGLLNHAYYVCGFLCLMACVSWFLLLYTKRRQSNRPDQPGRTIISLASLAWACFEPAVVIPIATYLVLTYLNGAGKKPGAAEARFSDLSPEKPTGKTVLSSYFREHVAIAARIPVRLLQLSLALDNRAFQWLDALDGQLAFYEMQRKGFKTGDAAFLFLDRLLLDRLPKNNWRNPLSHPAMRIHLIGHSFGALVVSNLAKRLAKQATDGQRSPRRLQTLCLLEGALASNWFENEPALSKFQGAIASIFSVYDIANGVYYPLANSGRLSAGYVGLTNVNTVTPNRQGKFMLLVKPPKIPQKPCQPAPYIWNLDASRAVFQGPPALGGGHGDIFKDTVINLIWAVTRLQSTPPAHEAQAKPPAPGP